MLALGVAMALQAGPETASKTWQRCIDAHRSLVRYAATSEHFEIRNGKRKKIGHGSITYASPDVYEFSYRDNLQELTCTLWKREDGNTGGGVSEDTPSQFPGSSNANGYADGIVWSWQYAPLALAMKSPPDFGESFMPLGTTVEEKMDGVACLRLVNGERGKRRDILWLEKESLLIRRVRREFQKGDPELILFTVKGAIQEMPAVSPPKPAGAG